MKIVAGHSGHPLEIHSHCLLVSIRFGEEMVGLQVVSIGNLQNIVKTYWPRWSPLAAGVQTLRTTLFSELGYAMRHQCYDVCKVAAKLGRLSRYQPRIDRQGLDNPLCDAVVQTWSPIIDNSTSTAQFEHLIVGRKLAVGITVSIFRPIHASLLPTSRRQAQSHSWRLEHSLPPAAVHSISLGSGRRDGWLALGDANRRRRRPQEVLEVSRRRG